MRTKTALAPWAIAGAVATLTFVSGCDRAWSSYNEARLGRSTIGLGSTPLNQFSFPPGMQEHGFGAAFAQGGRTLLPPGVEHRRMAYLTDDRGTVVGRSYCNSTHALLGPFACTAYEVVAEIEVPADWFHEAPDDWRPEQEWQRAAAVANDISEQTPSYSLSIKVASSLPASQAPLRYALTNLAGPADRIKPELEGARSAARYLIASWLVMEGMHDNLNSHPFVEALDEIVRKPQAFRGITKDGFTLRWRHDDVLQGAYSWYAIRNLGDRRVEIRTRYAGLFTPLSYFGWGTAAVGIFSGYAPGGTRVAE